MLYISGVIFIRDGFRARRITGSFVDGVRIWKYYNTLKSSQFDCNTYSIVIKEIHYSLTVTERR
jgi:hypothetical protein